jgi:hypothetical protein
MEGCVVRCLSLYYFKTEKGDWVQPGSVVDLDPDEAAVYRAKGLVKLYRTEMVSPPETRVVEMPKRRKGRGNASA